ncbi:MAG: TlpA family protein disulfide reductase [Acidobacteriota bacterium]|nr:TlpA family protein disulfide reductase [Acidobacteriota bacterium]
MVAIGLFLFLLSASPDFVFQQSNGTKASLRKFTGDTVVIAFLHSECEHCQAICKALDGIAKDYAPKGVRVLGILFDNGAAIRLRSFKDRYARGFPVGVSNETDVLRYLKLDLAQGYFVPIIVFVDRKGNMQSRHLGDDALFQDAYKNIRNELNSILVKR